MKHLAMLAFVALAGCEAHFQLPMTASQLESIDSGPALVAYLGQSDASAVVCDPRATGPHLRRFDDAARDALVEGLTKRKVPPELWSRCVSSMLKGLQPEQVASLSDALAKRYRGLLTDGGLATDPVEVAQLTAIHRLYLDRKPGVEGHPEVMNPLFQSLRDAVARHAFGPVAARFAQELVDTLDIEHGTFHGQAIDAAMMDSLQADGNELTLTRFAERAPDPALRTAAKRRLIRIHLALSPFPELREQAAQVEETVLAQGRNPIVLAAHAIGKSWLDPSRALPHQVVVSEHVVAQTATLLAEGNAGDPKSVLPEVSLRGALWSEVSGFRHALTVCGHGRELDPSPCLAGSDVTFDNPLAYVDKGGAFHVRDEVPLAALMPIATHDNFTFHVLLGGQPVATMEWGLRFERPDDLHFEQGEPLKAYVDLRNPHRFLYDVKAPTGRFVAIVEANDARDFQVSSRGRKGETGQTGSPGYDGNSASDACGDGGRGEDGGNGYPGGPGGDGGDVELSVQCGTESCEPLIAMLQREVVSLPGPGGDGGAGGNGGNGGSGGAGRAQTSHTDTNGNTVVDDPGCSPGVSGSNGSDGAKGIDGPPGHAGRVMVQRLP